MIFGPPPICYTKRTKSAVLSAPYSASEDEPDTWDVDESSVVYPLLKQEYHDTDIEIVEGLGAF